jgi:hypothetical protein
MLAGAELFESSAELVGVAAFADSRRAGRWATLGGVLLRAVLAVPYPVVLPPTIGGEVSLNLFLAAGGVSGGGKGTADKAAADALVLRMRNREVPRHPLIPIGTGEGLNRTYARAAIDQLTGAATVRFHARAALFGCRDIATVTALTGRQGATFIPELLKAYMGEELGFANADKDRRVILPMHSYRLCLSAGVQPDNGSVLLNDQAQIDGLPQRFLWLPVREGQLRSPRTDARPVEPVVISVPDFGIDPFTLAEDEGSHAQLISMEVDPAIVRTIVKTDAAKDADARSRRGVHL